MDTIHELSHAVALPDFDIFGIPGTQTTVERGITTEYRPIASLDGSSTIEFQVPTSADEYVRLEDTQLYLRVKVTATSSSPVASVEKPLKKVSPVNYLLHSMIKQVDLMIGDKLVTASPQTYAYRAYLEALLGYSQDAKKSYLGTSLWMDDPDKRLPLKNFDEISQNGEIDLIGRLHLDLAQQNRVILGGCKLTFKLHFNETKFFLMADDVTPKVSILDAALFVHKSKAHPMVVAGHAAALLKAPAKYPITHKRVKSFTINKGVYDVSMDNIHIGQLPRRIIVAMVPNDAFNGSLTKNPFYFDHFNIIHFATYVNGIQYPQRAYNPDFSRAQYARELYCLVEALNQNNIECTVPFNRLTYANGNTIFAVNYSADHSAGCVEGHSNPIQHGSLRLEMRFKSELPETITVIVLMEFDKIIEIDQYKNAAIEFN